jgi:hypothetical protein
VQPDREHSNRGEPKQIHPQLADNASVVEDIVNGRQRALYT